jgi:hypothetical protein
MRRARVIILACAVVVTGALLMLVFSLSSPTPVALLKIVDAKGKGVSGAVIKPDGLRVKNDGSHFRWGDDKEPKPLEVTTDRNGYGRVPYPRYTVERLETSEISFGVEHPDFCQARPFAVVDPAPPRNARLKERAKYWWSRIVARQVTARPPPVILKRGAVVKVSLLLDGNDAQITNVQPQLNSMLGPGKNFWTRVGDNQFISKRVEPGTNLLRMIGLAAGGGVHFSEGVVFNAVSEQTIEFRLTLAPGVSVAGRLDDSVPRPVTNGRAQIQVYAPNRSASPEPLDWRAWSPIAADGTFTFESLPRGDLDVIAICDGYVSKNDPNNQRAGSARTTQPFSLMNAKTEMVVLMEPAATCEITVLNDMGQPIEGAEIAFWPNVLWRDGSTIFGKYLINSADLYRNNEPPNWD